MDLSEAILVFFFILSQIGISMANQYDVGGSEGWSTTAKTWSSGRTFEVGDIFTFNYDSSIDIVLEVNEGEFRQCTSFRPLAAYMTGRDTVTLDNPGKIYFISGNMPRCFAGERMNITVYDDSGSSCHRDPYRHHCPPQSSSSNSIISGSSKSTVPRLMLMLFLVFWRF